MNTSADPSRARRRRRIRRLTTTLVTTALVMGLGGYTIATATAAIPDPAVEVAPEFGQNAAPIALDSETAQAVVDAQELPTAIGFADGTEVWSNDETAYSLGSIAKLVTVLVAQQVLPLEPGAEGETYVWTEEDAARTDEYLAVDGVAYAIPVGSELTQRDMLTFIFLPSANDYAYAYAMWAFGSEEAYLEAVAEFTAEHGLTSLQMVEPTGMNAGDQASAADLVRIARLALADPAIAEFNAMPSAEMPWGVGLIENSNPLLGVVDGVIGTKTGTLSVVGSNLIVSQQVDAHGRDVTNISVTLARPGPEARAASGIEMLEAMAPLPQTVELVAEGVEVGSALTVDGVTVPLVTAGAASAVLLPGETASRTLELTELGEGPAGQAAGVLRVATPTGEHEVPVVTTEAIVDPGFGWKFTHPGEIF